MGGAIGWAFQSFYDNSFDPLIVNLSWRSRTRFVKKRVNAALEKPLAQGADGRVGGAQSLRNLPANGSLSQQQNHARAKGGAASLPLSPGQAFQFVTLFLGQSDRLGFSSASKHGKRINSLGYIIKSFLTRDTRDMIVLNSQPKQIVAPPLSDPEKSEPFDLGVLKTSF